MVNTLTKVTFHFKLLTRLHLNNCVEPLSGKINKTNVKSLQWVQIKVAELCYFFIQNPFFNSSDLSCLIWSHLIWMDLGAPWLHLPELSVTAAYFLQIYKHLTPNTLTKISLLFFCIVCFFIFLNVSLSKNISTSLPASMSNQPEYTWNVKCGLTV